MTLRTRGFVLLVVQAALVLTVAAKYEWERHTRPAVWVQVEPFGFSAEQPRTISGEGRYGRLQLHVDACGLSTASSETEKEFDPNFDIKNPRNGERSHRVLKSNVRTVEQQGRLVATDAGPIHAADVQEMYWDMRLPCTQARLLEIVDVYLPQGVQVPYTVAPGATLWALVTVPKSGPPRPVQLAISDATGFHPWKSL